MTGKANLLGDLGNWDLTILQQHLGLANSVTSKVAVHRQIQFAFERLVEAVSAHSNASGDLLEVDGFTVVALEDFNCFANGWVAGLGDIDDPDKTILMSEMSRSGQSVGDTSTTSFYLKTDPMRNTLGPINHRMPFKYVFLHCDGHVEYLATFEATMRIEREQ